jgi:cell division protein FtsB
VAPLFCSLVLFYLAFHAVSGDRGVVALFKESRKLELLKAELAQVRAERDMLDAKVRRLSNDSLDLDLLDEQVRRVLGLMGKNEVVYILDENVPK